LKAGGAKDGEDLLVRHGDVITVDCGDDLVAQDDD
jgi:hypothetical protein